MEFLYPVSPAWHVSQTFQQHVGWAVENNMVGHYNGGIDWAVPMDTPVKAAQAGKVLVAKMDVKGYGRHVRIQHADGYMSLYAHLLSVTVSFGYMVQAGDLIGRSGSSGNSTGPHLHFEVRLDNVPIDPAPLLGTGFVDEAKPEPPEVDAGVTELLGDMPTFFLLPQGRITADTLKIRAEPRIVGVVQGYLIKDQIVDVIRHVIDLDGNIWLQIGHRQYIAMLYNGNQYVRWQAVKGSYKEGR